MRDINIYKFTFSCLSENYKPFLILKYFRSILRAWNIYSGFYYPKIDVFSCHRATLCLLANNFRLKRTIFPHVWFYLPFITSSVRGSIPLGPILLGVLKFDRPHPVLTFIKQKLYAFITQKITCKKLCTYWIIVFKILILRNVTIGIHCFVYSSLM